MWREAGDCPALDHKNRAQTPIKIFYWIHQARILDLEIVFSIGHLLKVKKTWNRELRFNLYEETCMMCSYVLGCKGSLGLSAVLGLSFCCIPSPSLCFWEVYITRQSCELWWFIWNIFSGICPARWSFGLTYSQE